MQDNHRWTRHIRSHLPDLNLHPEREADIIAELAAQFEHAYLEALQSGKSHQDAQAAAESHVQDWDALARELRDANRPQSEPPAPSGRFSGVWLDVKYASRSFRTNPGFAAVAIFTLAFGIASNTAVFTVVDHIALRALPYQNPDLLLSVEQVKESQPEIDPWSPVDNMIDIQRHSKTLAAIAGVSPLWNLVLTQGTGTERLEALYVSSSFFPMLGVAPVAGRLFTAQEDDRTHPANVALLSHEYWTRRFGGSPSILGRVVQLDGVSVTIIGVLPHNFRWLGAPLAGTASIPSIWMPLAANQLARSPRTLRFLKLVAQRRTTATEADAISEVRSIGQALTADAANTGFRFDAVPLDTRLRGPLRPTVLLLLGAIGLVLLMASVNVANLLLARATARSREIAIRSALGASAGRLIRQLLIESAALASWGGLFGLALAYGFVALIVRYGPPAVVGLHEISIDPRAVIFTMAAVVTAALAAGVVPAWRSLMLKEIRGSKTVTANHRNVRVVLSMAQTAVAIVLLVGSGLLIRSLLRVLAVDPGFDPTGVVSISTQLPTGTSPQRRAAIYATMRDKLLAFPEVTAVGAVSRLPLLGQNLSSLLEIEGHANTGAQPPEVEFRAATASYFEAMRIPLVKGALFDDNARGRLELLIDSATAQRYFQNVDPIGKRVRFLADRAAPWFTVIGVVGSVRHFGLDADARPTIYRHPSTNPLSSPILVIRGSQRIDSAVLSLIVRESVPGLATYNEFSLQQLVDRSTLQRRFLMWILTAFALAALILACIGTFGTVSQTVVQRTREIGIRVALGAPISTVTRDVLSEGLLIAGVGAAVGLSAAWFAVTALQNLLFQVQSRDARVFISAVGVILASTLLACGIPAWRAARIDPAIALREE